MELTGRLCLFVFDDLMFAVCEDKNKLDKLHGYVMKDCHHCNCSRIFVCEDLMYKVETLRMILSNSNYIILFQNIGDKRDLYHVFQTRRLAKDVFSEKKYGYIVFDNVPSSLCNGRIRTDILKN